MATQIWPQLAKAAQNRRGAIARGSTSSSTIAASFPPSSSVTRFRFEEALARTFLPVATDPVNEILSMSGCPVIHGPRSLPPATVLSTPGGRMSREISPIFKVVKGVFGDGFCTAVLPV